ncbi:ATP-binding protein [Aquirufa nivalisilvae]
MENFDPSHFLKEIQKLSEESKPDRGKDKLSFQEFIDKLSEFLPSDPVVSIKFLVDLYFNNNLVFFVEENSDQKEVFVSFKSESFSDSKIVEFFSFLPTMAFMCFEMGLIKSFPKLVLDLFSNKFGDEPFSINLKQYEQVCGIDLFVFLYAISYYISYNNKRIDLYRYSKFMSKETYLEFFHRVSTAKSILIKDGLLVAKYERYSDELGIKLSNRTISMIFPNWEVGKENRKDYVALENYQDGYVIYQPNDLKDISLCYNLKIQKFKERVELILKNTSKEKLSTSSLSLMISGYPGTGKTAFAKQICKELDLTLMFVEVSEVQTKFVGETEQNIHKLFSKYRRIWMTSERPVVLLFNECDQLFGKKVLVEKSSDMYLNAIQSQLLNEMENFNGILIATCNSTVNFEEAFKRRFLFHAEFDKPDVETRKRIWSGIEGVWTQSAKLLDQISQYDLTGAQIDNVLKKMNLLSCEDGTIQTQLLFDLIEEEELICSNKNGLKIGF